MAGSFCGFGCAAVALRGDRPEGTVRRLLRTPRCARTGWSFGGSRYRQEGTGQGTGRETLGDVRATDGSDVSRSLRPMHSACLNFGERVIRKSFTGRLVAIRNRKSAVML